MDDTALELTHLLSPLRRAVLRAAREAESLPDIPDAQIELLRVLIAAGPISTGDAAVALRVARPTVSNLVKRMAADGLVERIPSDDDLRSALLAASPRARDILARFDASSAATVAGALDGLSVRDRARVTAALPALRRLVPLLEGGRPEVPQRGRARGAGTLDP